MYAALPAHIIIPIMSHVPVSLLEVAVILILVTQTIKPQTEAVKYLGLHFHWRLNWKEHIARKKTTNLLTNKRDQLVDRKKSHLSIKTNYSPTKR
jgi:hypothetical protein